MEDKKVSWNVSQGLIAEIGNRRSYANTFFINGNVKKAFKTLMAMKQSVIQSFNEEERKKLKDYEESFNKISPFLSSSSSGSFNKDMRKASTEANLIASRIYTDYNDTLMDLLEKYDYLIGAKADASAMRF